METDVKNVPAVVHVVLLHSVVSLVAFGYLELPEDLKAL